MLLLFLLSVVVVVLFCLIMKIACANSNSVSFVKSVRKVCHFRALLRLLPSFGDIYLFTL